MGKVRALLCKQYGEPDQLRLEEIQRPRLGSNEVRIKVHACGVNFPDILMIRGQYQIKPALPFAPGCEVAGTILEVGEAVQDYCKDDRVIAIPGFGGMQEEITIAASKCLLIPRKADLDLAAVFSLTYGTSYHALVDRANVRPGETIVILGATGGVGSAAVDISRKLGARVIAAGSSDKKLEDLASFYQGITTVNYSSGEATFKDRVKNLTNNRGADVVFDPIGGEIFQQSLRAVNWKARILVVGFAADGKNLPRAPTNLLLLKGSALVGVYWGRFAEEEPERSRENFDQLLFWLQRNGLTPHISHRFPLEKGGDAVKALINRQVLGKCLVYM
ncbi:MAG: NADPH:quinone oxidoreductase [Acidiferrobacteraceae bacterium]|nr:NADPH:quinone oxidoreductase [Acidiferrobacteraceae bacterium]|tara:strand:+ start:257 stop:1255 length:999 start_codon:yes stop_codon:yes gene_type:complete